MKFKDGDLTPIFPPEVKPVHAGEYLTFHENHHPVFLNLKENGTPQSPFYWDGLQWLLSRHGAPAIIQNKYWCGLNRDPRMIAKEMGE